MFGVKMAYLEIQEELLFVSHATKNGKRQRKMTLVNGVEPSFCFLISNDEMRYLIAT